MPHVLRVTFATATYILSLAGCANLQTRPGNPDSYKVALSGGPYYETSGLKALEWPTTVDEVNKVPSLEQAGVPVHQAPPAYKASAVPREIWQARGATWNMHLKYLTASYKAEQVQDFMAVPLFGTAIATVALGIAKASTVSVAATGLGGTSLYAAYAYQHPDKDVSTDQTAAFSLRCVVDQSLPLRTMSAIPLILDKAALRDALDQLATDSGPLMALTDPSTGQKAARQAVTAAQSAAKQTMTNLDTNINLYDNMPTLIYSTMDKIDQTAQTGGLRTIDYNGILSSLQGAAANKSANVVAQDSATNAKMQASNAKTVSGGAAPAAAVTQPSKNPAEPVNLASVTTKQNGTISAVQNPSQTTTTDPGKAGTNQNTATKLNDTLASTATSDLQKVTNIASDANEDLAAVDYQAVAVNIQACTTGQFVAPAVIAPTTPAATTDKTEG